MHKAGGSIMLKKGQISIEFIMLQMMLFLVFVIVYNWSAGTFADISEQKERDSARAMANRVQKEFLLAQEAHDGYYRVFRLPRHLSGGYGYNISFLDNQVIIQTEHAYADALIPRVGGLSGVKEFRITKDEGKIHITGT